ncbi:MAG: FKBP-type peptidyl-prolyl cis-trans isomerase [Saprospiraceae bacterium]|nr:FKBP-type peptidyl-prolyl cis-trans isomerase [Saprospiraceae bacterium]
MNNNLFFSLLCVLLIAGCSSEGKRIKSPSGYEYQVVRKGGSEPIPVNSYVFFNMSLTQKDSVLQSTATMGKPSILKVMDDNKSYGQLKALVDIIATLHEGDSLHFYFPMDSFEKVPPGFEGFKDPMIYKVGIVDVMDEARFEAHSDSIQKEQEKVRQVVRDRLPEIEALTKSNYDAYKKGDFASKMQTTASGLKYIIHQEGDGAKPAKGEQVSVHYYGMLDADAKMFDTSFKGGQPYQFPLGMGQVIPGWDEGLLLLNKGSKATLFVPASLAYGAAGSPPVIPENADLIFYVELEK